ncbi:MAG: hypothetical protein CMM50_13960 [Rhodospirillaceae bacterium]|nr:hypothetical protein [Rhodospirillaceae bacterium]
MIDMACLDGRHFTFDPAKTALLVIDMQRDFCDPQGQCGMAGENVALTAAIIPRVAALLGKARDLGLHIAHTREGHLPDLSDLSEAKRLRSRDGGAEIGERGPLGRYLVRGEYGHDFFDQLQPAAGEPVFDKPGFDAFYKTSLAHWLTETGTTHVLIAGVTTECCVQSTLRGAIDRGFYCLTFEDCTAAYYKDLHDTTFRLIVSQGGLFGWAGTSAALFDAAA